MPTLLLNRQCRIIDPESTAATIVCEARPNVSAGTCARITPDPDRPYSVWGREDLQGIPGDRDGRSVDAFAGLPPGCYEAHSTLRSSKCPVRLLRGRRRRPDRDPRRPGRRGPGDRPTEWHDAGRAGRRPPVDQARGDGLPPLDGSLKQAAWAERLRGS